MSVKSTTPNTTQNAWADSVSDYILRRRHQNEMAYHRHDAQNSLDNNNEAYLFKAIFSALAKQLEAGHTVLILSAKSDENASKGEVNRQTAYLYHWQEQLLDILATPLFDLAQKWQDKVGDIKVSSTASISTNSELSTTVSPIFSLLNIILTPSYQPRWLANLTGVERQYIQRQLDLVTQIYALLQEINNVKSDIEENRNNDYISLSENSLSNFIQYFDKNPLLSQPTNSNGIVEKGNSLSNKTINTNKNTTKTNTNTPIIFQISTSYQTDNNQKTNNRTTTDITIWLHRTWQAEHALAKNIGRILNQTVKPMPINLPKSLNTQQALAVNIANNNAFSMITGGPGTGKTYTVAQLVIALEQTEVEAQTNYLENITFSTDSASLALAAPTGKAAQRMQESLQDALESAGISMQLQEAKTIHRLLGIGRNGQPRYHADNPLGENIIIVDEASMLGVELANYLVSAIKPGARLILLGDANQLAAVDAGAVLADLCHIQSLKDIHVELTESRRFSKDSGIGKLAAKVNESHVDMNSVMKLLREDNEVNFHPITYQNTDINSLSNSLSKNKILKNLSNSYKVYLAKINYLQKKQSAKSMPNIDKALLDDLFKTFNQFRILTAGHHGTWGDVAINQYLTSWHKTELKLPLGRSDWFHGRPIMVLQNNYELGLFNGDIGICLQTSTANQDGELKVFFENKPQGIAVNLLNDDVISTTYAMTIHKSQGSEFDHVAITFDNSHLRLLSKELIYTAITRAKHNVDIYATLSALQTAIQTPTMRQTGLALQFNATI